jgi:uncharacterized protein YndB with AHSA1/START domain
MSMTKRSVVHHTFTLERTYDVPPVRVFKAFSDIEAKRRWFAGVEGWETDEYALDFRVGGKEIWRGNPKGGPKVRNDTIYRDIIPDERIILAYDMFINENRISVSLLTVLFAPEGKGTRLTLTEQGAFLGAFDDPKMRESGYGGMLTRLGEELKRKN